MSPSESSPLLSNGDSNGNARQEPFLHRVIHALKGRDDEPSWLASYQYLFFGSWLNLLLLFVPLSILSDKLQWDVALRFSFRQALFPIWYILR
jgi:Ca2+:H+ antiporter